MFDMNYEEFYGEYQTIFGKVKDQYKTQQKLMTRINGNVKKGDLKTALRDLSSLSAQVADVSESISRLQENVNSVDTAAYLTTGDFFHELIATCGEMKINIKGEGNTYEIFPFRLRVDANSELQINERKAPGLRPKAIAEKLNKDRAKLLSGTFNAPAFIESLQKAYDTLVWEKKSKVKEPDLPLTDIYKKLTPLSRFRTEYTLQTFTLDIMRLYAHEPKTASDGREYEFSPGRNNRTALRIVDADGNEHYLAIVRFFRR
jgi:hypothetical protein